MLTRAVGIERSAEVDTFVIDLLDGDRVLLCSDGLSVYFSDCEELAAFMSSEDVTATPRQLISVAKARGGKDNVTAVVVAFEQETLQSRPRGRRLAALTPPVDSPST